jgi:hypothetical protein
LKLTASSLPVCRRSDANFKGTNLYLGCIVTNSLTSNLLDAGVFAEGGMKPYLQYVRSSSSGYSSRYVATTLEWRDDVEDGLEVSTRL